MNNEDIDRHRASVHRRRQLVVHLRHTKAGPVRAHLWDWQGDVLARAGGGGYDRNGAALGQVVETLLQYELRELMKRDSTYACALCDDGSVSVTGECGIGAVENILSAMGYSTEWHRTSDSIVFIATRSGR